MQRLTSVFLSETVGLPDIISCVGITPRTAHMAVKNWSWKYLNFEKKKNVLIMSWFFRPIVIEVYCKTVMEMQLLMNMSFM